MHRSAKRILLVDEHPVIVVGLSHLIDRHPDWSCVGAVTSCRAGLAAVGREAVDLVILEPAVGGMDGLARLGDFAAHVPVLCFSALPEEYLAERALRAGARGFLMKTSSVEEIRAGIRGMLAGDIVLSERARQGLIERVAVGGTDAGRGLGCLNDRELQIVHLIGANRSSREIAAVMHVSPKTVATHRHRIREKLSLRNASELVRIASRWVENESLS